MSINQEINYSYIESLINNEVSESKTIEYKREITLDKKEFLSDIVSFANTQGGDLIIGVEEGVNDKRGIPIKIIGVEIQSEDQERLRIEETIRTGIEPKVNGLSINFINIPNSNQKVIVIRINKSYNLPHMVKYNNSNKFYGRHSSGKYLLDVLELRNLFGMQEGFLQWIKNFRLERINTIVSGETTIPIGNKTCLILHIVPSSAYQSQKIIDLGKYQNRSEWLYTFSKLENRSNLFKGRYNLDGFVTFSGISNDKKEIIIPEYTQIFRNGVIETTWTSPFYRHITNSSYSEHDKNIPSLLFEEAIIKSVSYNLRKLKDFSLDFPFYVLLSLTNILGYTMVLDNYGNNTLSFDKNFILLPETTIESIDVDISKAIKDSFDILWNSVGESGSIYYDKDGNRSEDANKFRLGKFML